MSEVTWRNGALEVSAEAVITNLPAATRRRSYYQAIKRTADLVLAGAGLLVLGPVFLLLALVIRLDSRGSAFFSQVRVGEGGQEFRCWKFRSMYVDAEERKAELETENEMAGGVIFKMKRDPRITRVGRFIRKSSIDELPQLWNVFIGDMSLVGPRPEQPKFVERFRSRYPTYNVRHRVRAGITGWAQVNGLRGDTSIRQRIVHDLYYIENWSFGLDMRILWRTIRLALHDVKS